MTERGILFSGPMVRAILDGRKTQTRRVVESRRISPHGAFWDHGAYEPYCVAVNHWAFRLRQRTCLPSEDTGQYCQFDCPYGGIGDRLWVRETFAAFADGDLFFAADFVKGGRVCVPVHADDDPKSWRWTSSRFMPRKYSRLTLEVTGVRVERVQDISEQDAHAEGIPRVCAGGACECWSAVQDFAQLWDSINGNRYPWAGNPWVWVLNFKVLA